MIFLALWVIIGLAAGLGLGLFVLHPREFDEGTQQRKREKLVDEAAQKKRLLLDDARSQAIHIKQLAEKETVLIEEQNKKLELHLQSKEQLLQKKAQRLQESARAIQSEETMVSELRKKISETGHAVVLQLIQKVGIDKTALQKRLTEELTDEWKREGERKLHHLEEVWNEYAGREAKHFLEESIYRFSEGSSVDKKSGELLVLKDSAKGYIVGKGGKNIAFFEELFGVDVVFNDAPNIISLSCFNLVNRETARLALIRLMREKQIDEAKIKQVKELATQDMQKILRKEGEETVKKYGLKNVHPELAQLIGRLNYRTSYGQNALRHCIEVGAFARMLASEIGADEEVAFQGGFFHDIGKAIDQEVGGNHDALTKQILEKYGFAPEIVHAAWAHHDAVPQETVEAVLVKAADAISAGRPGARSISLEQYLRKIKALESTATSFEGVKKAYAISAGREVRVVVDSDLKKDEDLLPLADSIADKIEEQGGYPGKIKVTTIRLTKTSDIARAKK